MARTNEVGNQYGRLSVAKYHGPDRIGRALWECQCECGAQSIVAGYQLRRGSVQSCGCHRADRMRDFNLSKRKRHAHSAEIEAIARAMLTRP